MINKIQTLENRLLTLDKEPETGPQAKVDVLNDLIWELRRVDLSRAFALGQQVSQLLESMSYPVGEAYHHRNLAGLYSRSGDNRQALNHGQLALEQITLLELKQLYPDIFGELGVIYWRLGNLAEALDYFRRQLDSAGLIGDTKNEAESLNNIALIFSESGDFEAAAKVYNQALHVHRAIGNVGGQAMVLNNLAMDSMYLRDYPRALAYALGALQYAGLSYNQYIRLNTLDTLGQIYLNQQMYDQALSYLRQSLILASDANYTIGQATALLNIGRLYTQQQQYQPALLHLHQALPLLETSLTRLELVECYRLLAENYEQRGDLALALQYYKQFHVTKEQVFNQEADQRLKNLQVIHQTESAKSETEIHRLKNIELENEIIVRKQAEATAQQRANELSALVEIGREISTSLDQTTVLRQIAVRALELLRASDVAIYLARPDGCTMQAVAAAGNYATEIEGIVLDIGSSLSGMVLQTGVAQIVNKPSQHPRNNYKIAGAWDADVGSDDDLYPLIIAPLSIRNETIGVITLWRYVTMGYFTPADLRFFVGLAQQAAAAIENVRLFEELRRAKEGAEAASRAKNTFLATMSHELRTPLNGILGYAYLLKQEPTLTPKQAYGLHIIEQSGEHLLTLLNDVLDLARIEAGKLELLNAEFNLPLFLQHLQDLMQIRAREKQILLRLEVSSLPTMVIGDERRLRQVLINLLGNAIKFTNQGSVTLKVTAVSPEQPDYYRFAVEDTGIGISPANIPIIFEPFFQPVRHNTEVGAGLGLTICRNLVNLMGGQLKLESREEEGSLFWFELHLPRPTIPQELVELDITPVLPANTPLNWIVPAPSDLAELLKFATLGDIRGIRQQLDRLEEQQDPAVQPFINELRRLARYFQIDAIQQLLQTLVN